MGGGGNEHMAILLPSMGHIPTFSSGEYICNPSARATAYRGTVFFILLLLLLVSTGEIDVSTPSQKQLVLTSLPSMSYRAVTTGAIIVREEEGG
jgi:hypothetical protein